MNRSNQQRFHEWVNRLRAEYGTDAVKLREFNESIAAIVSCASAYYPTYMTATDADFQYRVDYEEARSLRVVNIRSNQSASGWVRQLAQMKEDLAMDRSRPDYCQACGRNHKKYGMEIEFKTLTDSVYREALLRKLNGTAHVDTRQANFGIDGSGTPIELRNINAATADGLSVAMNARVRSLIGGLEFIADNFPGADPSITTDLCGIHVHMFHKGIARDKVRVAHSVLGTLINSYNVTDWESRARSGYGRPFAYRNGSKWCHSQWATELRMFNSFSPDVLKFALEKTELLLGNNFSPAFPEFERDVPGANTQNASWPVVNANNILAYFIHKGAAKLTQVHRMKQWLDANYHDFIMPASGARRRSVVDMARVIAHLRVYREHGVGRATSATATAEPAAGAGPVRMTVTPAPRLRGDAGRWESNGSVYGPVAAVCNETGLVNVPTISRCAPWCGRIRQAFNERRNRLMVEHTLRSPRPNLAMHLPRCRECNQRLLTARREGFGLYLLGRETGGMIQFRRIDQATV